jgi:hypothetical protein
MLVLSRVQSCYVEGVCGGGNSVVQLWVLYHGVLHKSEQRKGRSVLATKCQVDHLHHRLHHIDTPWQCCCRTFAYAATTWNQTSWSDTYTQVILHTSASFQSSSTPPHALFHNSASMPNPSTTSLYPPLGGPSEPTPSC